MKAVTPSGVGSPVHTGLLYGVGSDLLHIGRKEYDIIIIENITLGDIVE